MGCVCVKTKDPQAERQRDLERERVRVWHIRLPGRLSHLYGTTCTRRRCVCQASENSCRAIASLSRRPTVSNTAAPQNILCPMHTAVFVVLTLHTQLVYCLPGTAVYCLLLPIRQFGVPQAFLLLPERRTELVFCCLLSTVHVIPKYHAHNGTSS